MKLVYENGDSVAISSLYQIVKDKIEMPEGYELTAFDIDGQVKADPEHSMESILINQDKYVNLRCNKEIFPLFFEALEDGSSLTLKQTDGAPELCVKISYDNETWHDYAVGDTIELQRAGDRVFFRSGALVNRTFALSEDAYSYFEMSGKLKGGGDIMSLVDCRMDAHDLGYECCFRRMFENCDALTTPPCLTMISLSPRCYDSMFKGCSSLVQAPKLPITFLKEGCYESMFEGCSSLVQAPALPAEKLAKRCYAKMFKGCSSLRSMDVGFTEWNDADGCTEEWIPDARGTFTHFDGLDLSRQDVSHVPFSWDKERKLDYLSFTAWADNSTVALGTRCADFADKILTGYIFEFSVDRENWFSYSIPQTKNQPASVFGKTLYLANFGDTIYIRSSSDVVRSNFSITKNSENKTSAYWGGMLSNTSATLTPPTGLNANWQTYYARYHFNMSGKVAAGGSIMSLLDKTVTTITGVAEQEGDSLFAWLFYNCTALVTPPKLPLKTLTRQCYAGMFYNCTSLKSAPALPAEKLVWACYTDMFYNCASLREAPALASTELASWCYYGMFYNCDALKTHPQLQATDLSEYCYQNMFFDCDDLTEVRPLPAAVLAKNCYASMFAYCRHLKQAPDLAVAKQAENACYAMYMGCERLERAPDLSAQTLAKGCYGAVYANCKNLANGPAFAFDSYGSADSNTFANSLSGCTILRNATVTAPSYDAAKFATNMFANVNTPGTLSVSQAFYEQCGEHPAFLPATWTAVPAEEAV